MKLLVIVHIAVTLYLVGLIWTVQIVQYPLFNRVDSNSFPLFAGFHAERITMIVMFPMLIELGTAFLLLLSQPKGISMWVLLVGVALVVIVWISTMLIQVPLHNQLANGMNQETIQRLTTTNWIRTIAWSVRGVMMLLLLWQLLEL